MSRKLHFTLDGDKAICTTFNHGMFWNLTRYVMQVTCKKCIYKYNKNKIELEAKQNEKSI